MKKFQIKFLSRKNGTGLLRAKQEVVTAVDQIDAESKFYKANVYSKVVHINEIQ